MSEIKPIDVVAGMNRDMNWLKPRLTQIDECNAAIALAKDKSEIREIVKRRDRIQLHHDRSIEAIARRVS